jgi:hypothetical protein
MKCNLKFVGPHLWDYNFFCYLSYSNEIFSVDRRPIAKYTDKISLDSDEKSLFSVVFDHRNFIALLYVPLIINLLKRLTVCFIDLTACFQKKDKPFWRRL